MNERVDYGRVNMSLKVGQYVPEKSCFDSVRLQAIFGYIFRQLKWLLLCCY